MIHGRRQITVTSTLALAALLWLPCSTASWSNPNVSASRPPRILATFNSRGTAAALNPRTGFLYLYHKRGSEGFDVLDTRNRVDHGYHPVSAFFTDIAVSARLNRLYLAADDGIHVLDGHTHELLEVIDVDGSPYFTASITALAVDPFSGRIVGTESWREDPWGGYIPGRAWIVDGNTHEVVASVPVGQGPASVGIVIGRDLALVGNAFDGTVSIFRVSDGAPLGTVNAIGPSVMGINHAAAYAYLGNGGGFVTAIDVANVKRIGTALVGGSVRQIEVAPRSGSVFVHAGGGGIFRLSQDGAIIDSINVGVLGRGYALNLASERSYVGLSNPTDAVVVVDGRRQLTVAHEVELPADWGSPAVMIIDPTSGILYVSTHARTYAIWDPRARRYPYLWWW